MKSTECCATRVLIKVLVLAVGCAALSGCATNTGSGEGAESEPAEGAVVEESLTIATNELHQRPAAPEAPSQAKDEAKLDAVDAEGAPSADEYRIGPGDVLDFRSFDDESLSGQIVVRYDGHISLPLIPDLCVQGATREEATERVREAYFAEFIDPRISLSIVEPHSKIYYVMGNVSQPRDYPYVRPITLLDAINTAGGPRLNQRGGDSFVGSQGQLTVALIIRHVNGEREVMKCDLSDLATPGAHASDTPVYPNDIVYVPEGVNLVYVLGEVGRPGVFQLTEDMTLLQLLASAGGPLEQTGRLREVVLMRDVDEANTAVQLINYRELLKTGADMPLEAGDILYVPRKRLTQLSEFVKRFTGSVSPILSLYMQAYDAWYTDKRYNQLFDDDSSTGGLQTLTQIMRDVGGLTSLVP